MKRFIIGAMAIIMMIAPVTVFAQNDANADPAVSFSRDGKVVVDLAELRKKSPNAVSNILDLANEEKDKAAALALEAAKVAPKISEKVKSMDPEQLDAYVKVISGAIKTMCKDLGVAVNEFITSPAGMIIAGTVLYNYGGDELLDKMVGGTFDFIAGTLAWIVFMSVILFIQRKYFAPPKEISVEYHENGKKKLKTVTEGEAFVFKTDEGRLAMAIALWASTAILTLTCMVIAF